MLTRVNLLLEVQTTVTIASVCLQTCDNVSKCGPNIVQCSFALHCHHMFMYMELC